MISIRSVGGMHGILEDKLPSCMGNKKNEPMN